MPRVYLSAFLLIAATTPVFAAERPVATASVHAPPVVPPVADDAAGRRSGEDEIVIARMLRAGTDLSWLVTPEDAALIRPSPEQARDARAIVRLARVARQRGLDGHDPAAAAMRVLETVVLAEAARRDILRNIRVTDADVAARLIARPGRYDEYRLSHIFVAAGPGRDGRERTVDQALARATTLRHRLLAGADFAALARGESDDPDTASQGGELSSMFGVYMAPEFFPAARRLREGDVSAPVAGKFGYHLIRLDQRIPGTVKTATHLVTEDIRAERMPGLIAEAIARLTDG